MAPAENASNTDGRNLMPFIALAGGLLLPAVLLGANMWALHTFTVDDAYISYRYAYHLAHGDGLVYNIGQPVEGYSNFLWTVLISGAIRLGFDPDTFAKILGSVAAFGSLALTYAIAGRLQPFRMAPCIATWLLASSVVFSGYAVFGLETPLFTLLLLAGTLLFLRESDAARRQSENAGVPSMRDSFPHSGLVFALAALTRPEAPMFIGILMLWLGRRFFSRQNLLRAALFTAPLLAHMLWRQFYYGEWLPNTVYAKTGDVPGQIHAGLTYVQNYMQHAGAILYFALFGTAIGLVGRRRDVLAIASIAAAAMFYVIVVGGDWMAYFRFMAPFEPFAFLLVDRGVRNIADRRNAAANLALAAFAVATILHRGSAFQTARHFMIENEKHFWDQAAGGTARWLLRHDRPGELAIGDIGFVGFATHYPILDVMGLVDPVLGKLPGGYGKKTGPGFADHVFGRKPLYILIISSQNACTHPIVPTSEALFRDRRLISEYAVEGQVPLDNGVVWCIYQRLSP